MDVTSLTLLSTTVYGQASGNYDGSTADFVADPVKGVGYYAGQGSIQTVWIRLQNAIGIVTIQATLDENPDTLAWFDVYSYGDEVAPLTDARPATLTGNFVWLRAAITGFDNGTIQSVIVDY
jgi:hypothetical protein